MIQKIFMKSWKNFQHRFAFCFLLAALGGLAGCTVPRPDPLAGYHFCSLKNLQSNEAINDDYKNYIQNLHLGKRSFIGALDYFENESGQHAVDIKVGVDDMWWEHVIIYNKENRRIKVIKYPNGHYES